MLICTIIIYRRYFDLCTTHLLQFYLVRLRVYVRTHTHDRGGVAVIFRSLTDYSCVLNVVVMNYATWNTVPNSKPLIVDVLDLATRPKRTRVRRLVELDEWWSFLSMPQDINLAAYGKGRTCEFYKRCQSPAAPPVADSRVHGPAGPVVVQSVRPVGFGDGVRPRTVADGHCTTDTLPPPSLSTTWQSWWKRSKKSIRNRIPLLCCCAKVT